MDRQIISDITSRLQALVTHEPFCSNGKYEKSVKLLNMLLDAGGAEEGSPYGAMIIAMGEVIADYEDLNKQHLDVTPIKMLRFLMQQHQLTESDIPEIGSEFTVTEILCGKRELNVLQIKDLAERFHVPTVVFINTKKDAGSDSHKP
jgi:HTH-type transcriptional regulator/antitoxin HigA